ncbi:MAG: AAA family ATPase, partial [Gammaproteobacteria bacterium]|nr:AAA family ATPase [Gammaproteobacteria bacterium]
NTTTAITRQTTNIAIFGRDEETAKIEQALREAQNEGAGSLLLLEGDAGIGKSTLMEYAASRAQDLNIAALKGGADAIRKDSSFYPWRQVFATLLELEPGSENTEEMTSRLIQSLPKERRQLAPLLSAVLPYEIPDNDVTKRMSEEVRADNTLSLLLEVLGTATENGSIGIFLEDAHWFDSASWKLISLVARSNDSILFVISTRPTEVEHPLLSSLFELGGANKLHVSPLSAPATVDLVCHRLGVDSTPESVSEFVMEKAGGNPFFSEELAYALLESGVITIADRVCELADPDTDPGKSMANMLADKGLPDTIQGIVTSRIDRLSEQLQFAIKVASAIGVRFTVDSLVAVYPEATSKKSMLRWLDELSEGDFIDVDSENSGVFEFRHVITRDVAYHSMLFSQRRKLHRRIASWFEEQSNSTSESMQPVLAHHWQHADEWERATSYLTRAGDNAMRNFSNREAISFYSDALEISNKASEDGQGFATTDDRRHWKLSIGRAHLKESEYQTGRTHIEQGLSLAGIEMKKGKLRPIFGLFSQMGRQVLHRYRAGRIVGSRHDDRKSLLEQARALEGLVEAYFVANENIRCLHCAFQSLNIAELAGPSPELARGYASVGAIMGFIPLHGIAKKYCDRAMDAAEKTDEPETLAWVSLAYGVYEAGAGNLDEARRHLFNTTAVAKKRGDRRRWDDGTQNLAATAYIRGELDKSLEFGSDLFSSAERRGDKKDQAEALRWIIRVRLARRNLEKLPELIQRFLDLRQGESGIGEKYSADVRVAQADFVYAAGDLAKAQALADDAMTLVGRGPSNFYDVFVEQSALADIYYALFSNATSNKNFSQLNSLVNVIKRHARVFAVAEPTARYWDGVIKRLRGRHKAARAALESAIDCAERMKMPIQEARIRAELAKNKTISESARERHLAGAVKILSAARARSDLARIDAN